MSFFLFWPEKELGSNSPAQKKIHIYVFASFLLLRA